MRQVLFRIPIDGHLPLGPLGDVPVFGFGLLLLVWTTFGLFWLIRHIRERGWAFNAEESFGPVFWTAIAAAIVLLPRFSKSWLPEGIPVFGYGFMLFLGFTFGGWFAARRAKQEGLPPETIWDLTMWGFVGGIVGARIFYLVQHGDRVFAGKHGAELLFAAVNLSQGGIVFYGGLIGGVAAYFLFCHRRGIHPLVLGDIILPGLFIGMGFGRLGCFLNGCCWGDRCELPWAVQFPKGSVPYEALVNLGILSPDAALSLPLHPTQIYSSIDAFILAALTAVYFKYRRRPGEVVALGWLIYPVTRFLIEFLRADESGQFNTSLTISQWVSLLMFAGAVGFVYYLSRTPPARLPVLKPEWHAAA